MTTLAVIARSPCDEAIQGPRAVAPGLLRCARNDGGVDATEGPFHPKGRPEAGVEPARKNYGYFFPEIELSVRLKILSIWIAAPR